MGCGKYFLPVKSLFVLYEKADFPATSVNQQQAGEVEGLPGAGLGEWDTGMRD
jgi:hypothetical protein